MVSFIITAVIFTWQKPRFKRASHICLPTLSSAPPMRNVGLKLTGSVYSPLNFHFRRKARFLLIKIHSSFVINAVYLPLQNKNHLRGFCSQDDEYTRSRWQYLQLYLGGCQAPAWCGRAEVWGSTVSSSTHEIREDSWYPGSISMAICISIPRPRDPTPGFGTHKRNHQVFSPLLGVKNHIIWKHKWEITWLSFLALLLL